MGLFFIPKTYKSRAANVDFFWKMQPKKTFTSFWLAADAFKEKRSSCNLEQFLIVRRSVTKFKFLFKFANKSPSFRDKKAGYFPFLPPPPPPAS